MDPVFAESGAPLSAGDIAAAERELGLSFPPAYVAFMLACNGGKPQPGHFRTVDTRTKTRAWWRIHSLFVIEAIPTGTSLIDLNHTGTRARSGMKGRYLIVGIARNDDRRLTSDLILDCREGCLYVYDLRANLGLKRDRLRDLAARDFTGFISDLRAKPVVVPRARRTT